MWSQGALSVGKTIEKKSNKGQLPLQKYLSNARLKFEKERDEIPVLQLKLEDLKRKLNGVVHRFQYRYRLDVQDEMARIEEEICVRVSKRRDVQFEEKIAPFVSAYRERVEVSDKSSMSKNVTTPGAGKSETIDAYIHQTDVKMYRQSKILDEYLMEVENNVPTLKLSAQDDCPICQTTLLLNISKAIMSCPDCGYSMAYLDATISSMSYSDDIEFSSFSYKRQSHFNDWLQQVQAKESSVLPDHIVQAVMEEMYRQRVISSREVTQKKVREVVKKLRLRKAYDHIAQLTYKLTGVPSLQIPPEGESMCRLMFIAVLPEFEKHCPKDRKNFLSYSYCLYKFFQLLGYDQFLESFSLLKGVDKMRKQDEIFKKICVELDWEWIES